MERKIAVGQKNGAFIPIEYLGEFYQVLGEGLNCAKEAFLKLFELAAGMNSGVSVNLQVVQL